MLVGSTVVAEGNLDTKWQGGMHALLQVPCSLLRHPRQLSTTPAPPPLTSSVGVSELTPSSGWTLRPEGLPGVGSGPAPVPPLTSCRRLVARPRSARLRPASAPRQDSRPASTLGGDRRAGGKVQGGQGQGAWQEASSRSGRGMGCSACPAAVDGGALTSREPPKLTQRARLPPSCHPILLCCLQYEHMQLPAPPLTV
jgi:hypothetical protein